MDDDSKPKGRLSIMVPMELLDAIEDWRRRRPRIPSLAEASRVLLAAGLAANGSTPTVPTKAPPVAAKKAPAKRKAPK